MVMKGKDRWLARFFHLFLTTFILVIVFIKDTQLNLYLYTGQLNYVLGYMTLVLLSTVFYLIASFMDPGYAKSNTIDIETGVTFNTKEEQAEILEGNELADATESSCMLGNKETKFRLRRCGFCDIIQPLRAKHCEECQQCIQRYDHHCPWLGACVGEKNHKFFLAFLFLETCTVAWTIHMTIKGFHFAAEWKLWFQYNWVILTLTLLLCVVLLVVGLLWLCHSYMMCTAQTTWEFMSRPRISYLKKFPTDYNPFDRGYLKNILSFLCYFKVQKWDQLYPK